MLKAAARDPVVPIGLAVDEENGDIYTYIIDPARQYPPLRRASVE